MLVGEAAILPPLLELEESHPESFQVERGVGEVVLLLADQPVAFYTGRNWDHCAPFVLYLAELRLQRGLLSSTAPVQLSDVRREKSSSTLVPHLWSRKGYREVRVMWEQLSRDDLSTLFDVEPDAVSRWALREAELRRFLMRCRRSGPGGGAYLSFRWIVNHEIEMATAMTSDVCRVDHVSLHLDPDELDLIIDTLEVAGLFRVGRPQSVENPAPGVWLVAGNALVHLDARGSDRFQRPLREETARKHVSLKVASFPARCSALRAMGIELVAASSAGNQVWFSTRSGVTIELQPLELSG